MVGGKLFEKSFPPTPPFRNFWAAKKSLERGLGENLSSYLFSVRSALVRFTWTRFAMAR